MSVKPSEHYTRYRAPTKNEDILCDPSWDKLPVLAQTNHDDRSESSRELFGHALQELTEEARREFLEQAVTYTSAYSDTDIAVSADTPVVVTGHQPELVHTGVWLKNFAADQLAKQVEGIAVNLIVDNDLCRAPSIRVVTGTVEQPRVETIAFDQTTQECPYEERKIVDRALWDSFGPRVEERIQPLVADPLVSEWWNEAVVSQNASLVGTAIAQGRHRTELSWGCCSLEVPQSLVCQTRTFRWFMLQMLAHSAEVHKAYNEALAEYRQVHRLRNHAQPLPDLELKDDWIETPFWIWQSDEPIRRALFVQKAKEGLRLSDLDGFEACLPEDMGSDFSSAIETLAKWEGQGVKIRSRALITTLYARLFLADLFIHGIGGAKYDQVTDAMSHRLFGWSAAPYATLSGTLHLPIEHESLADVSLSELRKEVREIAYHPEVVIRRNSLDKTAQEEFEALKSKKMEWVHTTQTEKNALQRHQNISSVNEALQPWLTSRKTEIANQIAVSEHFARVNLILESREYPFCLFPRETLQKFLLDFRG